MSDDNVAQGSDGFVLVTVRDDGHEAVIKVVPGSGGGFMPSLDTAKTELRKNGIVFGIDESTLRDIFSDGIFNQEIVVARGTKVIDGIDAKIKFYFDVNKSTVPEADEKGNVDYKNINLLQNVEQGTKLAEIIPPVPGKPGKSVYGKDIMPKIGAMQRLPSGINTELSTENDKILVASKPGNVFMKGSLIQVDPIYVVPKDVDYSTGNINYIGALVVKGDVKAGFEVKCQSDLEVNGIVEDATLESEANVLIKGGFIGKKEGMITAGGNVSVKFVDNQNIEAKGSITVGEYVMHSNLTSESKIIVTGAKGAIVGGVTNAKKGLHSRDLGNYQEVATEIICGVDSELEEKLVDVKERLEKSEENLENVKKAIYKLIRLKTSMKSLPAEQEKLLQKLQHLQTVLPSQQQKIQDERNEIEAEMAKFENVEIVAEGKVYHGVKLRIGKYKKTITKEMSNVTFKIIEAEIQVVR